MGNGQIFIRPYMNVFVCECLCVYPHIPRPILWLYHKSIRYMVMYNSADQFTVYLVLGNIIMMGLCVQLRSYLNHASINFNISRMLVNVLILI